MKKILSIVLLIVNVCLVSLFFIAIYLDKCAVNSTTINISMINISMIIGFFVLLFALAECLSLSIWFVVKNFKKRKKIG